MEPMDLVSIARIEERRQAISTAELAIEAEPVAGGWMAYGGPGSWANQACGLGLDGPVSDEALDALVAFYTSRGVEPRLEVCPFADQSLIDGLARRGFRLIEFENVLVQSLRPGEDWRARLAFGWPEGLELVHVDPGDVDQTRRFIEASTSGFRALDEPISEVFFNITRRMVEHPRCDSYLALVDGQVAGGGAMECGEEIGCLYGTSIMEGFRRRGIQAALIVKRLERATERGASFMAIHSSPGIPTERNALRLGFNLAYTKVVMTLSGEGLMPSP